jgi:DNA-binding transcriptional LysR family regulator
VAVAEELSFRRAALRLHVSHPALSQQIQDLEDEIRLKLFERNARRVQLTEAGTVFLVGARRVIADAREAIEQAQEAYKGDRDRLVIGAGLSALTGPFLEDALARFRAQFPEINVTVLHLNYRRQIRALLDGSIMLGIGPLDVAAHEDKEKQLCSRLLIRSSLGIVCSRDRRFPKDERLALSSLKAEKFLSLGPEFAYGDWLRELCRRLGGFEPDISARTNSSDSIRSMVAAGMGIFVCSKIGIGDQMASLDFYLLKEGEGQFELYAKWEKRTAAAAAIHKFIETIRESIKDCASSD